jgi:hypothetical protein
MSQKEFNIGEEMMDMGEEIVDSSKKFAGIMTNVFLYIAYFAAIMFVLIGMHYMGNQHKSLTINGKRFSGRKIASVLFLTALILVCVTSLDRYLVKNIPIYAVIYTVFLLYNVLSK